MGGMVSSAMAKGMEKQQDFMVENQKVMLERQLVMQNSIRERQMAMQVARGREMLNWSGSFAALTFPIMIIGGIKKKNPALMGPIVPMSFVIGYQWDMAYNKKMVRVRHMAEDILESELDLIALPNGMPTLDDIERRRLGK